MRELIDTHRALLDSWRKAMNLVGPGEVDPHYEDSLQALEGLNPKGLWADLGTGAGFPGVVLSALHPELELHLVDSRKKRCVFLQEVFVRARAVVPDAGDWNARVLCTRVEALESGAYDGVIARAFAPPLKVLEHAGRLLRPGGCAVLMLTQDQRVPEDTPGFTCQREHRYEVQGKRRCVRHYTRTELTPEASS